jgi:ketohexokinase
MLKIPKGRLPDVTIECIRYIRDQFHQALISVEVEKPGRPGLHELAEAADVVFYSKGWAQVKSSVYLMASKGVSNE